MRVLIIFLALWCPTVAYSHDGPVDPYGCHSNKTRFGTTSPRECHVGLLKDSTYTSLTEELKAYIIAQGLLIDGLTADVAAIKAKVLATLGSLTISWNANLEPDLAGYRIYCGTQSKVYSIQVQVAKTLLTTTVPNLPSGTYYCVVKAYDTAGNESAPSTEVSKVIP